MNKKKLKKIVSLALAAAMLAGPASAVKAATVSEVGKIKNNSILIGKHIFELDKTKENLYNMDTFVKSVKTLENDNDKIYYKVSDHWVVLNDIHTAEELATAINATEKHKDNLVQEVEVKKVNGMFILETPANHSKPEEGSVTGTTKIQNLNNAGIDGAAKWQVKVQNDAFDIPVLDSKIEDAVDYTAGSDINIAAGQRLLLLAADDNGYVKGYAELIVDREAIKGGEEAAIVDIKDAKLKEVINHTIDENRDPAADITLDEMEAITELSSEFLPFIKVKEGEHTRGINDISGLEYAKNLVKLDLSENRISDLTPLRDLTKLTYIEMDRNNLADLTPLANLKELEHLNIYNNAGIVDTTPISGLTKLKWIDMHYCSRRTAPVNVEPLGNLINLEFLSIDDNFVEDISFTEKLVKLSSFSCNNNYVTDLTYVQDLAVASYNDWSGERFFNMFGQMLKEPVKVNTASEGTIYKMDTPVTGNNRYLKKVETDAQQHNPNIQVPGISVLNGDKSYISAVFNHDTDQIELSIAKNTGTEERSSQFTVMLDYGMYSLKVTFDVTQEGADAEVVTKATAEAKKAFNDEVAKYIQANYTEETWTVFNQVVIAQRAVVNTEDAAVETINNAKSAVVEAAKSLVTI